MQKSLDAKLARIHADPHGCKDFILADAKDADMALSIGAPGLSPEAHAGETRYRTLAEFRDIIAEIVSRQLVDIMLMSASTSEVLTIQRRLFDNSPVTPAARANDTTDIHVIRGSVYPTTPSMPFRTATLDHIQCGYLDCKPEDRPRGANLGLYSITFMNDTVQDRQALEQYKLFREEAERKGFRHFLEIFDPNTPNAVAPDKLPAFINDAIVRTLGGVTSRGRPDFLKMVYHGPKAMEELVRYDPHLVVGILGGGAGTTYDAFKLLAEAQKYGARVALFGRKINNAEHQVAFIHFLRLITDRVISPEEAVKAYHGVLQELGIKPQRPLADDMVLRTNVMAYGGSGTTISVPPSVAEAKTTDKKPVPAKAECACACPCESKAEKSPAAKAVGVKPSANGHISAEPDFAKMTPAEKVAWHKAKWDRILG